jgi:hypothetical protein
VAQEVSKSETFLLTYLGSGKVSTKYNENTFEANAVSYFDFDKTKVYNISMQGVLIGRDPEMPFGGNGNSNYVNSNDNNNYINSNDNNYISAGNSFISSNSNPFTSNDQVSVS